jgi:hypothetical protein
MVGGVESDSGGGADHIPRLLHTASPSPGDSERASAVKSTEAELNVALSKRYEHANPDGTVEPFGRPFHQTHEARTASGHKLHVAADNCDDVRKLAALLEPLADEYGLGIKYAMPTIVEPGNVSDRCHPSWKRGTTKAVTIYLPDRDTVDRDMTAVAQRLAGYQTDATVPGDNHIVGAIYHRYEFSSDPGRNVTPRESRDLYERA